MRIAYYPRRTSPNIYSELVMSELSNYGEVREVSPKSAADIRWLLGRPDICVVNWLENLCVKKNGKVSLQGTIFCLVWFFYLRMLSRRIVYVRHNIEPHTSAGASAAVSRFVVFVFRKMSSVSVTHSPVDEAADINSRVYVPHPLYPTPDGYSDRSASGNFLFFGMITPQKGLLELIQTWQGDGTLTIAGVCLDNSYLEELRRFADSRIKLYARFLPEIEVASLFSQAQAVLLPNTGGKALVSASFMHAISYGKPVIAVSSPFLESIRARNPTCDVHLVGTISELAGSAASFLPRGSFASDLRETEFSNALIRRAWDRVLKKVAL